MIRLKNITEHDDIIECDFLPEDATECGHMVIDRKTKEVTSVVYPAGYEDCKTNVSMARWNLLRLEKGQLPKERLVMWY